MLIREVKLEGLSGKSFLKVVFYLAIDPAGPSVAPVVSCVQAHVRGLVLPDTSFLKDLSIIRGFFNSLKGSIN